MYATKPEENGFFLLFFFFLSFFQGSEFYMRSGALHYISAVLTLHAKRIVYGALTKDEGEDKKKYEFTSEIERLGPLQSYLGTRFQAVDLFGVANGPGWVGGAGR